MPQWRPDFDPLHLYFVTTSAHERKHLFEPPTVRRLIADALDCGRLRRWYRLFGFVVMPNHVHLLIQCPPEHPLAATMRDLKKHIADRWIRQATALKDEAALEAIAAPEGGEGFHVWEKGYMDRDVVSARLMLQKLSYIHKNPCQAHWALASTPEAYTWSSARYYLTEEKAIIPVDNAYRLLEEGVRGWE